MEERIKVKIDPAIRDLVPDYLDRVRALLAALRENLKVLQFDEILKHGHKLKGSGGGYGFDEITNCGRALEDASKNKNADEVSAVIVRLSSYLERIDLV